jgi:hypothetical protein
METVMDTVTDMKINPRDLPVSSPSEYDQSNIKNIAMDGLY